LYLTARAPVSDDAPMSYARHAVLLLFVLIVTAACRTGEEPATTPAPDLTLDAVYARMERALNGDGDEILHASLVVIDVEYNSPTAIPTPEGFDDLDAEAYADQIWIDAENTAARVETRTRHEGESEDRVYRHIVLGDDLFRVDDEGRSSSVDAIRCRGSDSPLMAQLMRCGNWLEESTTVVESGEYAGDSAIILRTTGELPSHDWTTTFETRLYVDPGTYLPLAADHEFSHPFPYRITYRYDIEFVERAVIAKDFFEPGSIDYVGQADVPADNLAREINGVRIYWLGDQYDAGLVDPLIMQQPRVYPGERSPLGVVASFSYKLRSDATGYRGVGVGNYPVDGEAALQEVLDRDWERPSVTKTETVINGVPVRIYKMETDYGDIFRAHVYFTDALVVVSDYFGAPPYTGEEAFMRVVAGLRPFVN
jgi:hypothetical protein